MRICFKKIEEAGLNIIRFPYIIKELQDSESVIKAAAGNDLLNLMMLGR